MTVAGKHKDQNLNRIKYVHLEFDSKYRTAISLYIPIFKLNLLQLYNIYRKKSFKSLYLFVFRGILKLKIYRVYAIFELQYFIKIKD